MTSRLQATVPLPKRWNNPKDLAFPLIFRHQCPRAQRKGRTFFGSRRFFSIAGLESSHADQQTGPFYTISRFGNPLTQPKPPTFVCHRALLSPSPLGPAPTIGQSHSNGHLFLVPSLSAYYVPLPDVLCLCGVESRPPVSTGPGL